MRLFFCQQVWCPMAMEKILWWQPHTISIQGLLLSRKLYFRIYLIKMIGKRHQKRTCAWLLMVGKEAAMMLLNVWIEAECQWVDAMTTMAKWMVALFVVFVSLALLYEYLFLSSHVATFHAWPTVEITCGEYSAERFVYFRSPGYPQTYEYSKMCRVRVGKKDKSICQYRIDLLTFNLARPMQGNCSQDIFVVSGQNENHVIPKICGVNSGQHCA